MRSLSLDGDLLVGPDGNIAVVDRLESLRQRVVEQLNWMRGEWFLDLTGGVPYVERIFVRPIAPAVVSSIISDRIRSVPDVESVEDAQIAIDPKTRNMTYVATVRSRFGDERITLRAPTSRGRAFDASFSEAYG